MFQTLISTLVPLLGAGVQYGTDGEAVPASAGLTSGRIGRRVVKSFDFDERKLGNFERAPMNWRPVHAPGYPRFSEGVLDESVGCAGPPSFRLAVEGGSIASRYVAKDIPIHPGSRYRITGWVMPDGLTRAEAFVSVHYLDHALRIIPSSERRSRGIRGARAKEGWRPIRIR